jgi:hypothetical protein
VDLIINNKIKVCSLLIVVLLGIVVVYVVIFLPLTNVVKFGMSTNWWLQKGVDGLFQKIRRNHQGWWTFKKIHSLIVTLIELPWVLVSLRTKSFQHN